jgi:hypothetical protein
VRNVNAVAARMEDFQLSVTKTEQDEAGDVIGKSVGGCSAAPPKGSFEQAEQHFLDAAGAGGLGLLSDSGLQGCVADFDGHDDSLGGEKGGTRLI